MSKTKRFSKRYYDQEDYAWDSGDDGRGSNDKLKERRRLKKMKNALKTKDLDSLINYEE